MKTVKQSLLILVLATILFGCKKDKEKVDELAKQEILTKKIADIIPKEYQDSLQKFGIVINQDVNPPQLRGAFKIDVFSLIKSNVGIEAAGKIFAGKDVKFFDQDADNNIKTISKSTLNADTSITTAISGSGNQFTVYGKTKSVQGANTAIFGFIYSGEIDGSVIKNFKFGLISISRNNESNTFLKPGLGRVLEDKDNVSESIPMF